MTSRLHHLALTLAAVAALAACKEEGPPGRPAAAPASQALIINGAAVSPLCFVNMGGDEHPPVYPTQNCGGTQYIADTSRPSPLSPDFISTPYLYSDPATPEEKYPGLVGYKFLGDYRGLKAVQTIENGGGSGTFTAVQLLRPEKDGTLSIIKTLAGGDRCNGGISEAFMNGRTLVYSVSLTPYDFLSVADYNPKKLEAYDDLEACAVCCYGQLQYVDGRPRTVIFDETALDRIQRVPEEEQTMQSCFDEVFTKAVKSGQTALPMDGIRDFVVEFTTTCTTQ
jgi:hypothetical protein